MTDKLQVMLINVLLDQLFNTEVSQGSVATRLRCDGVLNDQLLVGTHQVAQETQMWNFSPDAPGNRHMGPIYGCLAGSNLRGEEIEKVRTLQKYL